MLVFGIIAIGLFSVLLVIMTNPRQNRADNSRRHNFRNRTRLMMVITQFLSMLAVILSIPANRAGIGYLHLSLFVPVAGTCLMTAGLLIRVLSMHTLGRYYSPLLFVNNEQPLIEHGLYRLVRHPIYLGDVLFFFAVGPAVSNYLVFAVVFLPALPAYMVRIQQEEKMMIASMGDKYSAYMKRTKKLLPFVY
ncbi:MAG: isoprenylcysteine carboxylmethyltransferase family protein [Spirochaetales bacterium]|nr:isoprenylcysteine carboxylmethyltransferase family protein [Spirochaetales bacterium]